MTSLKSDRWVGFFMGYEYQSNISNLIKFSLLLVLKRMSTCS